MNILNELGLTPGCTFDEVKKRYRALCLKYHPDKNDSSEAEKKYRSITKAYQSIRNNPSLLNPKKLAENRYRGFIEIPVELDLEDIYFYRERTITLDRLVICKTCSGTGFKGGAKGYCSYCEGTGKVKGKVIKLLNQSDICPVCKGIGGKPEKICEKCHGNKYIPQKVKYKIKFGLKDYHKKIKILRGLGNEYEAGKYTDVHLKMHVFEDSVLSVDGMEFTKIIFITPIQNIIGDEGTIRIYGQDIPYKVIPGEEEYTYRDKRPYIHMPERKIRFIYFKRRPRLTEETKKLYKKIMKIEKKLELLNDDSNPI